MSATVASTTMTDQQTEALKVANRVRIAGAYVRKEIASRQLTASSALDDPRAQVLRLDDVLAAQPYWGVAKSRKLMRHLGITPGRRLRELTERQKWMVCEALEDR